MMYYLDDSVQFPYVKELSNDKSASFKKRNRNDHTIRNVFSNEMSVLFIILTIIGAMPLTKNKEGTMSFKIISVKTIYSVIIYAVASGAGAYVLYQHIVILSTHNVDFDDKIKHYASILFMGFHFLPLCSFCEGIKMAKYCTSYAEFQARYYDVTGKKLVLKLKTKQYIMLAFFLLDGIFFYFFVKANLQSEREKYNLTRNFILMRTFEILYIFYLWIIQTFAASWLFLNMALWQTARNLLKDLKDTRLRSNSFNDLYALWLDLRNLTENLGGALSWTYIYYLVIIFLMAMGSSYTLISTVANPEMETRFGFLAASLLFFLLFGIIADCAHRTTLEVGENFTKALLDILQSETNPNLRKQIKWFLQTISIEYPIISLSGYVSLNRGFNVSMLGSLVTYIVVVLQFKTSNDPQPKSTPAPVTTSKKTS